MSVVARASGALLVMLALATLVGPLLAGHDPLAVGDVMSSRLLPPLARDVGGGVHLLGTDAFGRDLLARILLAGRISLAVGVAGSLLAAAAGVAIGAVGGWMGGFVDTALMAIADALLAIPRLILLLLCSALWEPGLGTVVIILVATGWMGVARMVRGEVLGIRSSEYVAAAHALGNGGARLLWRHVLPNALGPAVVAATLGVGNAILLESGLSFLGLGVQPPTPSWGNMIAGGRELIVVAPWVAIAPGIALVITVLAATLLGDAVRDRMTGEQVVGRVGSR